jgi:hypothetical protein
LARFSAQRAERQRVHEEGERLLATVPLRFDSRRKPVSSQLPNYSEGEIAPKGETKVERQKRLNDLRRRRKKLMVNFRATMAQKDEQRIEQRSSGDYHGPQWGGDWPEAERKKADPAKMGRIANKLRDARGAQPRPTVAISYRGGFGYDQGAFLEGQD